METFKIYSNAGLDNMEKDELWNLHNKLSVETDYHNYMPLCMQNAYKKEWLPFNSSLSDTALLTVFEDWSEHQDGDSYQAMAKEEKRLRQRIKRFRDDIEQHPYDCAVEFLRAYSERVWQTLESKLTATELYSYNLLASRVALSTEYNSVYGREGIDQKALKKWVAKQVYYANMFCRDREIPFNPQKLTENILKEYYS